MERQKNITLFLSSLTMSTLEKIRLWYLIILAKRWDTL